ncbi:SDR family NAD(P)-dependent oxidoreductase [Pseudonocardia kunmingensis]|uniref:NAD(P)-dependent dehydrogenase (Short-subunit alcohol dehydrogenase family) n=1 Tax=Pseudonocardia kunmingensis TaxID=630975 RepID=A0A543DPI8_9PSEU|nr:SDR family NAD(P)-dependent oxidoreductase [Pseudonocardia kunmingensis]TQM11234.1 NAD(P)-dependent dehydrogenase (short-subunit alcohol dehydrogenase family) [Pseudonocardia kunmingensis]
MELNGASALVTGGAGGFGEATVRRLVKAGAQVVVADMAEDKGKALEDALGSAVRFVPTDVTDEASVDNAIAAATELGPLRATVVVHGGPAAGKRIVNRKGEPYPVETFRRTVEIFLTGTYHVLSKAAAAMSKNEPLDSGQRGVVITTASIAGFEGQVGQSDYSAAKGGVIGLTLTAARDLAPVGVRVMCIAPGTFFTPAYRMSEEEAQAKWGPGVPNPKRMGHADEYAKLALQIVDNDYLNGETIRIDGALRFNI